MCQVSQSLTRLPIIGLMLAPVFCLFSLMWSAHSAAEIRVLDDAKREVVLRHPAKRIVSLAPHVTELVYAAGAGDRLVGVSDYSDFPEAAKKVPSIGSIFALDVERLLAIKPDLVLIWGTGNAKMLAKKLRDHQLTVFESEAHDFDTIASSLERIAMLTGTEPTGKSAALAFRQRLRQIQSNYARRPGEKPLRVFHQMVKSPLMTTNQDHLVSKMIQLCGGENVFAGLKEFSASITVEALILANPDFIFSGGKENKRLQNEWSQFPQLKAVQNQAIYSVYGDWLHRSGPRVLDATEQLCQFMQKHRIASH